MPTEAQQDWDQQASTFDKEPDHGLRDPLVRRHLLWALPQPQQVLQRWLQLLPHVTQRAFYPLILTRKRVPALLPRFGGEGEKSHLSVYFWQHSCQK